MQRRQFLKRALALPIFMGCAPASGNATRTTATSALPFRRVRPGDPAWPSAAEWSTLRAQVRDRLIRVESPLVACRTTAATPACAELFTALENPYYIGDHPGLTQTSAWIDAWTAAPSVYAVAAKETSDVVAAVNFARQHNLRLVVKGGGHSYQGTSNAPDSLLVWTRAMHDVTLHDAFVPSGCNAISSPMHAVSVGSGAIWGQVYNAVTTRGGRYVQGGGCATVGVAGLIQSGGFGSFSKNYGLASAGLLEAEVVTADGVVRIANACTNPDLFWALKGGGGGSLGVITRLTLATRELPQFFGGVFGAVTASSPSAYRELVARVVDFYHDALFNRHWGEQIRFEPGHTVSFSMVFQGIDRAQAERTWRPLLDWVAASPGKFTWRSPVQVLDVPARNFWDPEYMRKNLPSVVKFDNRPGASERSFYWAGDGDQSGQILNAYRSAWLPSSLLDAPRRGALVDALVAASATWPFGLHFNKGLGGAPPEAVTAARDTAMNPAVLDAFALVIIAANAPAAFPGVAGHEPDRAAARRESALVNAATDELLKLVPQPGSYVSESDYFERDWQRSFWGDNYSRLAAVKRRYDPDGLFFVHHGVGSEEWSADGFTRLASR